MKHLKSINENIDEVSLHSNITSIIDSYIYLRDVKYGDDGQQEVYPESIEDAADSIIKMLKKKVY